MKENLVASPLEWPGATSVHAYVDGTFEMTGHWVDHTAVWRESKLWHRRVSPSGKTKSEKVLKRQLEKEFTSQHKLKLTPLPKWDDLSLEEVSAKVRWMVEDIEFKAAARHKANGTSPLGVHQSRGQSSSCGPLAGALKAMTVFQNGGVARAEKID